MTTQEILEIQRKLKAFRETELGALFEKFVYLHARAWQLDERHGLSKSAEKAWNDLSLVERELRDKLMKIAGVE
jgi:hypothetical protein